MSIGTCEKCGAFREFDNGKPCKICLIQQRGETKHNHVTRDIKSRGECPSCDEYYEYKDNEPDEWPDGSCGPRPI